jgi:putative drug exporter of the RND superfamily
MLTRFARIATTRTRWVLIGAALLFLVAGAVGGSVQKVLTTGGFEDESSESFHAEQVLSDQFHAGVPNIVLLVTADSGNVDDADVAAAGRQLTERLADEPDAVNVVSYWSEGNAPPLRNDDGGKALIVGRIDVDQDDLDERIEKLQPRYEGEHGPVTVGIGGSAEFFHEGNVILEDDLLKAEMIALPITLVLLVLLFGSVMAGLLPVSIGVLSIMGTFLVLRVMAIFTDVSVYALNLTTALGLGLAIDYSLFVVSRYREELAAGHDTGTAVRRTVLTAGRTVAFSSLTVAASLCATLLFPLVFLRSFAYAGVAVAVLAGVLSALVLPAMLYALGPRVNALTVRRTAMAPAEDGFWSRMARAVMRRPLPVATIAIVVLLLLGAPFLGIKFSQADDRVLPESAQVRQVGDVIRSEFSSEEAGALSVVAADTGGDADGAIDQYAGRLAALPAVARVDAATGSYCGAGAADALGCQPGDLLTSPDTSPRYAAFSSDGGTYLSVVPAVEPLSEEGVDLVDELRDTPAPFPVEVSGQSATLADVNDALFSRLPYALVLIAFITAVLLFMMFGSLLIPAKAIVLNLLSLSATFGAMVWIFQEGHLSGVLDFTATGDLNGAMPILMFCVAFGLSMDYEVFLLSRIKEAHDNGADNETSVARGLGSTGRIVTAAAVLMSVVFLAFATGQVSFMKLFGLGLTLAVLLDAFVIRGTLVPAFMKLAGNLNWWAPAPLRRFHDRWGISGHVELDEGPRTGGPVPAGQGPRGAGADANGDRAKAPAGGVS